MSFLHGIEHLNLPANFTVVNDITTAVIGLIGTATEGETNQLIICKNEKDDAHFGTVGTIPEALKAIRMQDSAAGGALVIVCKVAAPDDGEVVTKIVGEVSEDGTRTGLKLFETALTTVGFEPMIYIAPRYSALAAVKQALITLSDKAEAMAYIDTPDGCTFNEAIASRTGESEFVGLTEGQKLLFPHFLIANPESKDDTDKYQNVPMSAFMAGLRAKVDLTEGWHLSCSNHRITGVEGLDVPLTFSLSDQTSEANLLNAAGITTAVNLNGWVEWGNYSAGFPANANTEVFECVRRTRAIMKRTIQQACIPFIDKPFTKANIDAIRNTVNQYLNGLAAAGKIVSGKCYYRPGNNPLNEMAAGHIVFDIEFTPALPMQRLTFTYKIDLTALSKIA